MNVKLLCWGCDLGVVICARLGQGCVTSEQCDPVPAMKRAQPHKLTRLNNSVLSVYPGLAGRGHLEDMWTGRTAAGVKEMR